MVILFLIALFLAWPTFGLSLVAYFAFLIFRARRKTKTRDDALVDAIAAPHIHETRKHFILMHCKAAAASKDIPRDKVEAYLSEPQLSEALDYLIAAKAKQGIGETALTTYVSDWFVEKCQERMRDEEFDDEIPF